VHATDLDIVGVVACVLRELPRRARLDDPSAHAPREPDQLAVDLSAAIAQCLQRVRVATEHDPDLFEDRVGVVLDERQTLLAEDLEWRQRARQERRALEVALEPGSAACIPSAAPTGRRRTGHRSSPWHRPEGSPPATPVERPVGAASLGSRLPDRQFHDALEIGRRRGSMGDRHGLDEMLLEARLDGGLDLLDATDDALDLPPCRAGQQRDQRSCAGSVAGRPDPSEIAVGDQPEDHGVEGVDLASERPGEPDLVDRVAIELVHQQPRAGVQGGLGKLDRADVVLGDDDPRPAVLRFVEHVAEGPTVGDHPWRPLGHGSVDDAISRDDTCQIQLRDDPR
jgi:hypothetical protein